ncbi:FeoA family protein [Thiomicrorhabdus sp.]|uniref:FeoA family protein n=1 Tax=Thiomicrorhabdus sp. TaxID=2039724 RepID=UPI0029C8DCC9|nr:FeoA family protein [Thiomicrorhabdus sp.]
MTEQTHSFSLSKCRSGQISQITALEGDLKLKMRLVNLGFHTHSIVELILARGHNLIVSVDGSRFAIDKQIAEHIQVEPLS